MQSKCERSGGIAAVGDPGRDKGWVYLKYYFVAATKLVCCHSLMEQKETGHYYNNKHFFKTEHSNFYQNIKEKKTQKTPKPRPEKITKHFVMDDLIVCCWLETPVLYWFIWP